MYSGTTLLIFFFFNDTATTEIYTLSLHDALPICGLITALNAETFDNITRFAQPCRIHQPDGNAGNGGLLGDKIARGAGNLRHNRAVLRSEEHTSELQSHVNLVCRLLLEKKKNTKT